LFLNGDETEMTAKTYVSRTHFDANLYSEPLSIMNMLWEYEKASNKMNWCWKYGIAYARVKRLASTCSNLQKRVAGFLCMPAEELDVAAPPLEMPPAKITILRVVQVWCFHDTLIEYQPRNSLRGLSDSGFTLDLKPKSGEVTESLLNQVLSKDRHQYEIRGYKEIEQTGNFKIPTQPVSMDPLSDIPPAFEERILSLAIHDDLGLVWVKSEKYFAVYVRHRTSVLPEFGVLYEHFQQHLAEDTPSTLLGIEVPLHLQRGFRERACGMYRIVHHVAGNITEDGPNDFLFYKFANVGLPKKKMNSLDFQLDDFIRLHPSVPGLSCDFKSSKKSARFCLKTRGARARTLSSFDRQDLFPFEIDDKCATKENARSQCIFFSATSNSPMDNGSKRKSLEKKYSSWQRPLFECIPEGARIISVLASGRRRSHHIRFEQHADSDNEWNDDEGDDDIELYPDPSQSLITFRWKRFGTDTVVYVQENSVPASAVPMDGVSILYCCCANTLEVKGGGLRAEGLTLLPPGKLFLLLCRFSFGLYNTSSFQDGSLTTTSIEWLSGNDTKVDDAQDWKGRIDKAIAVHSSTRSLGEELVCFPDSVEQLVSVFDGLNGVECKPWDDLHSNPFSRENLSCYR
jgi:hypothetical protein